jgi:hypothetical protein
MSNNERIGIVINGHELFLESQRELGGTVCYDRLTSAIKNGRSIHRAIACLRGFENDQKGFTLRLKRLGYEMNFSRDPEDIRNQFAKAVIDLAADVDTLVIVTCSSSIGRILEFLDENEDCPEVELWFLNGSTHQDLISMVDRIRPIGKELLYQRK